MLMGRSESRRSWPKAAFTHARRRERSESHSNLPVLGGSSRGGCGVSRALLEGFLDGFAAVVGFLCDYGSA